MAKRKSTKSANKKSSTKAGVQQALSKLNNSELVDLLMELAKADSTLLKRFVERFNVTVPPDELIAATHTAILNATDFEDRDFDDDFEYDDAAYREVKQNLKELVELGEWRSVLDLTPELMRRGSLQVEMSTKA